MNSTAAAFDDYMPSGRGHAEIHAPRHQQDVDAERIDGDDCLAAQGARRAASDTRLNLAMPSCDGFLGRYVLADGSVPGGFGDALDLAAASR